MPLRASESAGEAPVLALRWSIASDVQEIGRIVEAVCRACAEAGFSGKACRLNVPVALTEAITNAIECGNGGVLSRQVHVEATIDAAALCIEVTDEGSGFDTDAVRKRCADPDWVNREDGRGVFLMFSLMDHVETRNGAGHTVRLVLHRA
jgi:serine/threonine-protein kinase RsbW